MFRKNDLFFYLNPERRANSHFTAFNEDAAMMIFLNDSLGKRKT